MLTKLPRVVPPELLVGLATSDDAAVYRLRDDLAIVQTLDFFMPVVDDPRDYGRIAAANSISDVYAMGGRPILALAIVGLPLKKLPPEVMGEVIAGGAEVCAEAGIPIAGGHSIDDEEMKFGLSVTGVVHPDRLLRNDRGQAGDFLVLTKPVGSGSLATAVKRQTISEAHYAELVRVATFLNRIPSEVAVEAGLTCATDVTGFGVLGHAHEIAAGSKLGADLWFDPLPLMEGARASIEAGVIPGATGRNLAYYGAHTEWAGDLDPLARSVFGDPQTSGGLILAVPEAKLAGVLKELTTRGALAAAVIGRLRPYEGGARIRVFRGG
ncbi:selenide, water dikinase [Deltaproteobacteria bacterium]|nr:selenide, water dikinase [Deltaproteobacteria bacterium]